MCATASIRSMWRRPAASSSIISRAADPAAEALGGRRRPRRAQREKGGERRGDGVPAGEGEAEHARRPPRCSSPPLVLPICARRSPGIGCCRDAAAAIGRSELRNATRPRHDRCRGPVPIRKTRPASSMSVRVNGRWRSAIICRMATPCEERQAHVVGDALFQAELAGRIAAEDLEAPGAADRGKPDQEGEGCEEQAFAVSAVGSIRWFAALPLAAGCRLVDAASLAVGTRRSGEVGHRRAPP